MKLILTTDDGEAREQWYLIALHSTRTPSNGWDVTQSSARELLATEISNAVVSYRRQISGLQGTE